MKKVIDLNSPKANRARKFGGGKFLVILAAVVMAAFLLLLVVGFENVLALFRYRVALFLAVVPLFALFLWCACKAFGPKNKS